MENFTKKTFSTLTFRLALTRFETSDLAERLRCETVIYLLGENDVEFIPFELEVSDFRTYCVTFLKLWCLHFGKWSTAPFQTVSQY